MFHLCCLCNFFSFQAAVVIPVFGSVDLPEYKLLPDPKVSPKYLGASSRESMLVVKQRKILYMH